MLTPVGTEPSTSTPPDDVSPTAARKSRPEVDFRRCCPPSRIDGDDVRLPTRLQVVSERAAVGRRRRALALWAPLRLSTTPPVVTFRPGRDCGMSSFRVLTGAAFGERIVIPGRN